MPWSFLALLLTACGGDDEIRQGVADPRVAHTGVVVVTVRQHFTGELGVGHTVVLRRSGTDARGGQTDPAGQVTFVGVEAGDWELEFVPPAGYIVWPGRPSPAVVTVVVGETVRHVFEYVSGAQPNPVGELRVEATEPIVGGVATRVSVVGVGIRAEGPSGAVSELETTLGLNYFHDLPVGAYTLTVDPPRGYGLAPDESGTRAVQVVQSYETMVPDFRLRRTDGTGGLRGWVGKGPISSSFVPAPGAVIRIEQAGEVVASGEARSDGVYILQPAPPGTYALVVELPSGWTLQAGATLPEEVTVERNLLRYLSVLDLEPPP